MQKNIKQIKKLITTIYIQKDLQVIQILFLYIFELQYIYFRN